MLAAEAPSSSFVSISSNFFLSEKTLVTSQQCNLVASRRFTNTYATLCRNIATFCKPGYGFSNNFIGSIVITTFIGFASNTFASIYFVCSVSLMIPLGNVAVIQQPTCSARFRPGCHQKQRTFAAGIAQSFGNRLPVNNASIGYNWYRCTPVQVQPLQMALFPQEQSSQH